MSIETKTEDNTITVTSITDNSMLASVIDDNINVIFLDEQIGQAISVDTILVDIADYQEEE